MSDIIYRRRVVGLTVRVEGERVISPSTDVVAWGLLGEALRESREFPPPQAIVFELQPEGEPWSRYEEDNDWVTLGLPFAAQGSDDDVATLLRLLSALREALPRVRAALPAGHGFDADACARAVDRVLRDAPRNAAAFDARRAELARSDLALAKHAYHLDRELRSQMRWPLTTNLVSAIISRPLGAEHEEVLSMIEQAFCLALMEADLRTPGYDELHLVVAGSFDEAWDNLWSDAVWHRSLPVIVDAPIPKDAAAACQMLIDPLARALRELVRVDGLDAAAVDGVLSRFGAEGMSGSYVIARCEAHGLAARIHARPAGYLCECTLEVTRAATGDTVSVPLDPISTVHDQRFLKVVIRGDCIRVEASRGAGWKSERRLQWSLVREIPLGRLFS